MTRKCIKVLVRTRPTASFSQDQLRLNPDKAKVVVNRRGLGEPGSPLGPASPKETTEPLSNQRESWDFDFDGVLHNASQSDVYTVAGEQVVSAAMDGVNGTIMAYGQTGSGKTFTMTGDTTNFKQRGVTLRAIAQLFSQVEEKAQQEFDISVSYMEIYNERIFDLLSENLNKVSEDSLPDLQVIEDPGTHSMQVRGLSQVRVASEEEALDALFRGDQNRIIAEHQLNKRSNRSHSIFTIHIEQRSRVRSDFVLRSKLNLVDLAGSERLKKAVGEIIDESLRKESAYINKSLSFLEQCVVALTSTTKRSHIPYRQTKLTNVLKDSLGGNCNTVFIACISGESSHLEETVSTLKLAQRMRRVSNSAGENVQVNPALLMKRYERQIMELKQELLMRDALSNRSGVSYDDFSAEECLEIGVRCQEFVDAAPGEEEEKLLPPVESVRYAQECFRQLKKLVRLAESRVEERVRAQIGSGAGASSRGLSSEASRKQSLEGSKNHVGDLEREGSGFALGIAPASARPAHIEIPERSNNVEGKLGDEGDAVNSVEGASAGAPASPVSEGGDLDMGSLLDELHDGTHVDRERAFKVFSQGEGAALQRQVAAASKQHKAHVQMVQEKRRLLKSLQAQVEDAQRKLDSVRGEGKQGESKSELSATGEPVIDEEEFVLMKEVKQSKKQFKEQRESFDALQAAKATCAAALHAAQEQLLEKFQSWYTQTCRLLEEKFGDSDKLDDGEQFDQMELARVQSEDPDSVAFFKASKSQRERERRSKRTSQQSRRVFAR